MSSHDSSTNPQDPNRYEGLLPRRSAHREPAVPAEDVPQEVDQIAIRKLGGFNFVDVNQWAAMSRGERMKLIKNGSVVFLFQGREVALKPALLYIQAVTERAETARRHAKPPAGAEGFDLGSA